MPIRVWWHDEARTILRSEWAGALTLEEFTAADIQVRGMIQSVSHPVCGIIDWSQMHLIPANWPAILTDSRDRFPPQLLRIAIVRGGLAWETVELFNRDHAAGSDLLRSFYRLCGTVDEALALIKSPEAWSRPQSPPALSSVRSG